MALGRRTRDLGTDTRPGQVLALALLANAPIFLGFVLVPLFNRGDPSAATAFVPYVLMLTPVMAAFSLLVFLKAGPARQHRAAKIGLMLALTALVLWLLVLFAPR